MRRFVNGEEVELDPSAVEVTKDGDRLSVRTDAGRFSAVAIREGDDVLVSFRGNQYRVQRKLPRRSSGAGRGSGEMRAPMPGLIVDVRVASQDLVKAGDTLVVLEAMKTQQAFVAPFDGRIAELPVKTGDQVSEGALLVLVESSIEEKKP